MAINFIESREIKISHEIALGLDRYVFYKSFGYTPIAEHKRPNITENALPTISKLRSIFRSAFDYIKAKIMDQGIKGKRNVYTHLYITSRKFKN